MLEAAGGDLLVEPLSVMPEAAFAALRGDRHAVWLDSGGPVGERSRYSYVATDPFRVVRGDDPFGALAEGLAAFGGVGRHAPVPFAGGVMGFLGYEAGAALERVPRHTGPAGVPGSWLGFTMWCLPSTGWRGAGGCCLPACRSRRRGGGHGTRRRARRRCGRGWRGRWGGRGLA